ncbi:hypothetical protein JMUB6875_54830 [Nocardia sp. JMUB6875]|uniref:hypothetical protein n=1 Tax=Nocardia sp. JMUB6875 TaxID=3158170 RepID=UPI0032E671EF
MPKGRGTIRTGIWRSGFVAAACAALTMSGASATAHADQTSWFSLQPGNCANGFTVANIGGDSGWASLVPCIVPHDAEVVVRINYYGEPWPGEAEIYGRAWNACTDPVPRLVYNRFYRVTWSAIYPNTEQWWETNPTIVCVVVDAGGGQLIGGFVGQPQIPLLGFQR